MDTYQERMTKKKACTLGLIRRIEREGMLDQAAYEVFETLADYARTTYPEFTGDDVDDCVSYAMQACLF
jgi:hypothetical protein